ncbi:BgtTE-56071 [Blumeria graminis f. sp. tritici]|uniref:BgtTE-56071 n=1 Tax=Blumeria graminis f. sp. tritici TaxID=62690 RepID=A0A9X9QDH2_BLUGR|nr:BgtTE-56071 [Blumeria graminis f. sp. tritici]
MILFILIWVSHLILNQKPLPLHHPTALCIIQNSPQYHMTLNNLMIITMTHLWMSLQIQGTIQILIMPGLLSANV